MVKRNPVLSGLLSFFVPGLGQLYNCRPRLFFLFLGLLLLSYLIAPVTGYHHSLPGLLLFFFINFSITVCAIVSSAIIGWKNPVEKLRPYNRWYVYAGIIAAFAIYGQIYASYLVGIKNYYIPTGSMKPTILMGDSLIADPWYYHSHEPKRGDIVIFNPPEGETEKEYIKRCVAVTGDRLAIRNNRLYVNGEAVKEPYTEGYTNYHGFADKTRIEGVVPDKSVIVLGDNREHSQDSRYFGYVPYSRIRGKALFIWSSADFFKIGDKL